MTRRALEGDLAWILQEGVTRVVERLIESEEFSLGVRRVKAAWWLPVLRVVSLQYGSNWVSGNLIWRS